MTRKWMPIALAWMGALLFPELAPAQSGDGPRRERASAEAARRAAQARMPFRAVSAASLSGLEFAEVSDAIRAQIDLPEDSGVVVVHVRPNSPAMKAGLLANDLLLAIDGEPVHGVAQANETLARDREKEVKVTIIRAGMEQEIVLQKPAEDSHREYVRRLFEAPASRDAAKLEYWIGVPVSPVDATLRSHLASLPPEAGLIINDVVPGSPAEKAGLKKNDVLVTLDGQPLTSHKALVEQILASEGRPIPLEYLRAGKIETVKISPEKHEAPADRQFGFEGDPLNFRGPGQSFRLEMRGGFDPNRFFPRDGQDSQGPFPRDLDLRARIERDQGRLSDAATKQLEAAIKELTAKIEDLRKSVEDLRKVDGEAKAKDEK